ncbi:MAG: sensor signal transduction histidine kinase [Chthoniobacteraceae bacterium]|nr:sensor signal transduction histidine kinase [Chthoniobacteraceae bacterium]
MKLSPRHLPAAGALGMLILCVVISIAGQPRVILYFLCTLIGVGCAFALGKRLIEAQTGHISRLNVDLQAENSEQIRMHAELAYERDLLRTLLEHSPDQIYFKDLESRFVKCSNTLVERFELQHAEELIGKSDFDYFTDDHARPAFEDEQQIVRTGKSVVGRVEKELWKNSDKVTWALTTKGPLRDRAGNIIGTFGTSKDITSIKEAEAELEKVNKELLEISRQAGMAEVATSVLHNVGNVLNSVNISCSVISDKVRKSRVGSVAKTAELLRNHGENLGTFLATDPVGQKLPGYLTKLSEHLAAEQSAILTELASLVRNIEHIKEIVTTQQSYAVVGGVRETLPMVTLVEDALRMNEASLSRHRIEVIREYEEIPPTSMEKHKVLQILVNLVSNARQALTESAQAAKRLIIRIRTENGQVVVSITDNGLGILPENMTRIFAHGFTTKKNGHGFGLHSGVLAAQQMGGRLTVQSDGPGTGATFTLELPLDQGKSSKPKSGG